LGRLVSAFERLLQLGQHRFLPRSLGIQRQLDHARRLALLHGFFVLLGRDGTPVPKHDEQRLLACAIEWKSDSMSSTASIRARNR